MDDSEKRVRVSCETVACLSCLLRRLFYKIAPGTYVPVVVLLIGTSTVGGHFLNLLNASKYQVFSLVHAFEYMNECASSTNRNNTTHDT